MKQRRDSFNDNVYILMYCFKICTIFIALKYKVDLSTTMCDWPIVTLNGTANSLFDLDDAP